jgi:hypothetical protein
MSPAGTRVAATTRASRSASGSRRRSSRTALLLAAVALAGCGGKEADAETIGLAKQAYQKAKAAGIDMSPGPCLGVIKEDWVADVAHDPRQDVDDDPANQCEAYRNGDAHHFVELDPSGKYIRSR